MLKHLPIFLLPLLLLGACASPTGTTTSAPSLSGYFKSTFGDGFEVSGTSFKQYDDAAKTLSFAGTIANNPDLKATAGTLIVRITTPGTWAKTVDTYYAIRWKNLTSAGASASSASAYPAVTPQPTTLSEATTTFAADGYFTYFGEYGRQ